MYKSLNLNYQKYYLMVVEIIRCEFSDFQWGLRWTGHPCRRVARGIRYSIYTSTNLGKRYLSRSIVNAIRGKYLKTLRRPNEGRKYNSNTFKNRNNRTKRLALLGRYPSRQPKIQIQIAKIDTKTRNTILSFTYKLRSITLSSQHKEL